MSDCVTCKEINGKSVWIRRPVQRFVALGKDVFQCWNGHTWAEPMNESIPAGNDYYDEEAYNAFVEKLKAEAGIGVAKKEKTSAPDDGAGKDAQKDGADGDEPVEDGPEPVTQPDSPSEP